MTEQRPSAEAMRLASRYADGEVKKCAAAIDALIAQRVSAETERCAFVAGCADHDDCEHEAGYMDGRMDAKEAILASARAERPAPEGPQLSPAQLSPAVVDYTERAREIIGRSRGEVVDYIHGSEPLVKWRFNERLIVNIAAALSAVAAERDAAAIRAFGKVVWSDTEEVAYQAGVSDTRERLQEPDVREAVRVAIFTVGGWSSTNLHKDKNLADAAIARIVEMLK